MPKLRLLLTAMAVTLLASAPAMAAKSAYDTGISIAKKRGYPNPDCYATVFASYAAQSRDGKFKAPTGKAAISYKNEQMSKCSISL